MLELSLKSASGANGSLLQVKGDMSLSLSNQSNQDLNNNQIATSPAIGTQHLTRAASVGGKMHAPKNSDNNSTSPSMK